MREFRKGTSEVQQTTKLDLTSAAALPAPAAAPVAHPPAAAPTPTSEPQAADSAAAGAGNDPAAPA
jgi:hypothetical protein